MANSNFRTLTLDKLDGVASTRNYIKNGSALQNVKGWATYADAAGTSPVDGTGGSPTVTWTRTTSSPLSLDASFLFTKDAASRQGEGASYDFTIDRADQAKVCRIDFDYEVASGTYADGDLTVWLYDVTNAQLIQPSASSILNAVGPQKKQPLSFQTNSNSTSYRLIIHVASTSASAYTVKFDNVSVTRESIGYGSFAGYLGQLTTTSNWTSNTTHVGKYWRTAEGTLKAQVSLFITGTPTTSTNLYVNLPAGLVIDTARMSTVTSSNLVGEGKVLDTGTTIYKLSLRHQTDTSIGVLVLAVGGTYLQDANSYVRHDIPNTFVNGDEISIYYEVPIVGWSSSQQLSSDADTREVSAKYSLASNETTAANADHIMTNFTTKVYDSHGMVSGSRLTAPVPGKYKITLKALTTSVSWAATDVLVAWLGKNGATQTEMIHWERLGVAFTDRYLFKGNAEVELKAGETIDFNIRNNTGGGTVPVIDSVSGLSTIEIEKLSGPAQIAASEKMIARYSTAAGQSMANGASTLIDFGTKTKDTHSSVTTGGSWKFTAQSAGDFEVNALTVLSSGGGWTAAEEAYLDVYKNGSFSRRLDRYYSDSTHTARVTLGGIDTIELVAGDYIDIRLYQGSGAAITLLADAASNYVIIKRIG